MKSSPATSCSFGWKVKSGSTWPGRVSVAVVGASGSQFGLPNVRLCGRFSPFHAFPLLTISGSRMRSLLVLSGQFRIFGARRPRTRSTCFAQSETVSGRLPCRLRSSLSFLMYTS